MAQPQRTHHHFINYTPPPPPPPPPSPDTSFPILAISILGILTTAILLLSYYIFVIKCCLNWHRSDVIRRLSRSRRLHRGNDPLASYPTAPESRGLVESAIQAIPTFRFRGGDETKRSFNECAVCLNEFQEEERIRMLPNCFHVFHIDCIDTWLQSNANCPLCRQDITSTTPFPSDQLVAEPPPRLELEQSGDIVIEMRDDEVDTRPITEALQRSVSVKKIEEVKQKKRSRGDECIDVRGKDEQFSVQPIRRSFSMDSSSDRQLYRAVQEILQQNPHFREVANWECSSSSSSGGGGGGGYGRARRHFFSFGSCRSSRSSVLPI